MADCEVVSGEFALTLRLGLEGREGGGGAGFSGWAEGGGGAGFRGTGIVEDGGLVGMTGGGPVGAPFMGGGKEEEEEEVKSDASSTF